jgi:hypothetical protein
LAPLRSRPVRLSPLMLLPDKSNLPSKRLPPPPAPGPQSGHRLPTTARPRARTLLEGMQPGRCGGTPRAQSASTPLPPWIRPLMVLPGLIILPTPAKFRGMAATEHQIGAPGDERACPGCYPRPWARPQPA